MYRSKIWRTRLDATTNWAVVTTGIAMSIAFSAADANDEFVNVSIELFNYRPVAVVERLEPPEIESSHTS